MQGSSNNNNVTTLRKGPWTAEEDEILQEYVRKHGPRNWSSIRSKGLLPRTGKSCRLRWVNKLKPDLKTGCKFSEEEERIVIELQAEFGNKWAKIAKYLPGRTDNDVKNFWSTRRKRLSRLHNNHDPMDSKMSSLASYKITSKENNSYDCCQTSYVDNSGFIRNMLDETEDLTQSQENTCVSLFESSFAWEHFPYPSIDFPLADFSMDLSFQESLNNGLFFDSGVGSSKHGSEDLGVFLDDFPTEIFDESKQQMTPTSSSS